MKIFRYIAKVLTSVATIFSCLVTLLSPTELEERGIEYLFSAFFVYRYELVLTIALLIIFKVVVTLVDVAKVTPAVIRQFDDKREMVIHTILTLSVFLVSVFLLLRLSGDVIHLEKLKLTRVKNLDEYTAYTKLKEAIDMKEEKRYGKSLSIMREIPQSNYENVNISEYMKDDLDNLIKYTNGLLRPVDLTSLSNPPIKRLSLIRAAEALRVRPRLSRVRARLDSSLSIIEGYQDLSDSFFAYCKSQSMNGSSKFTDKLWILFDPTLIYDETGSYLNNDYSKKDVKEMCSLVKNVTLKTFQNNIRKSWKIIEIRSILDKSKSISK